MQVNFTFDKAAVERRGHALEDVHRTVKSLFAAHALPWVSAGGPLAFTDKGPGDESVGRWGVIPLPVCARWVVGCGCSRALAGGGRGGG